MKLTQIRHNGVLSAAIVEDGKYRPVPNQTTASLIVQAQASAKPLAEVARALALETLLDGAETIIPIHPEEVWACGCTYAPSAEFRDGELGT
ncbi:MAG: 2-keto-3-deoxy-D-arabinonate dehydratase, partial [Acidobacteria bacterium]|nr:2-keto-3-deoxy-D-arabinonate dehydratase [Acidobacteriota bacterium]